MLKNKIVWSEGMFLQPQHFQQQERYFEFLVHQSFQSILGNNWGISRLEIDTQDLMIGKFSLKECQGIFPDGMVFDIPSTDKAPPSLSLSPEDNNTIISLAVPLKKEGLAEISLLSQNDNNNYRYTPETIDVFDTSSTEANSSQLQISTLSLSFKHESEAGGDYLLIGLARIKEVKDNHTIILDKSYIPPLLNMLCYSHTLSIVKEVHGLLHQKGESLSQYTQHRSYKETTDIEAFLILQLINRYESLFRFSLSMESVKPEIIYCLLIQLISELSTFTEKDRRPPKIPGYFYNNLQTSFDPLIKMLAHMIKAAAKPLSVSLPLEKQEHGVWISVVEEKSLFPNANFILAVSTDMPKDILQAQFPLQAKSAPLEHIWDLIKHALPGISFQPLTEVPHQIPYNQDFTYFLMDNQHALWAHLEKSSAFAFYVGNQFPNIKMELWAIKK